MAAKPLNELIRQRYVHAHTGWITMVYFAVENLPHICYASLDIMLLIASLDMMQALGSSSLDRAIWFFFQGQSAKLGLLPCLWSGHLQPQHPLVQLQPISSAATTAPLHAFIPLVVAAVAPSTRGCWSPCVGNDFLQVAHQLLVIGLCSVNIMFYAMDSPHTIMFSWIVV